MVVSAAVAEPAATSLPAWPMPAVRFVMADDGDRCAARARRFVAGVGLQACVFAAQGDCAPKLLMADWKPYEGTNGLVLGLLRVLGAFG